MSTQTVVLVMGWGLTTAFRLERSFFFPFFPFFFVLYIHPTLLIFCKPF